ncbi:hypothetical protein PFISCL1PPCAC_2336, partial [Pristionchus fissidentatus]
VLSTHHNGFGQIKLIIDQVLPIYVEKVILLDTDMILLGDVQDLQNYLDEMDRNGNLFATTEDMYKRTPSRLRYPHNGYGENTGTTLYNLKKMREEGWSEMWRAEADRLLRMLGPLAASEQDIFTSMAVYRPEVHLRLPCEYNFQMGTGALQTYCIPAKADFMKVKIPHWSGKAKWSEQTNYLPHFNNIYKCLQKIDGSRFQNAIGIDTRDPRTLLNVKAAAI